MNSSGKATSGLIRAGAWLTAGEVDHKNTIAVSTESRAAVAGRDARPWRGQSACVLLPNDAGFGRRRMFKPCHGSLLCALNPVSFTLATSQTMDVGKTRSGHEKSSRWSQGKSGSNPFWFFPASSTSLWHVREPLVEYARLCLPGQDRVTRETRRGTPRDDLCPCAAIEPMR